MLTEHPLVSIIIPTYNRASLIGETLDSVLAQTYQNWECIVVDDGSTDNTDEILAQYTSKDSRFQFYHRPENRLPGGNAARNYGFEVSNGIYVNWFDSDDLMHVNKIELQIKQFYSSIYDFVICQTMMVDYDNKEIIGLKAPKLISQNIFEDYIMFKIFWLTGAPLWKKSFLLSNKLFFDEQLYQGQDYDFHMRVLSVSENYYACEEPLVTFNYHLDNMSRSSVDSQEKIFSNILIIQRILKNFHKKLSDKTLLKKYNELLKLYKFTLKKRNYKLAFYCYKFLIKNLKFMPGSIYKKLLFAMSITTSLGSYYFLNKGERFLKIKLK
ncbi:glycosyltransferase family 2 protein [Aequorivita lipolytica]|uniref:glycosyltransferase family 2 protein n=1 Tax=Aequorivita lipolytica TaxID=153267 RepID=UPI000DBC3D97|nr:glycosyltransferase family 2 protein [Aequorivita lipolytica]SRX52042.1 putative glycosyltransferase EpsJ [Aequorivita lipolytica]